MKITDDCMACGMCVEYCPFDAIEPNSPGSGGYSGYKINKDLCVDCAACLDSDCPAEAIKEG